MNTSKTAIITGGGTGIGAAIAKRLAKESCAVMVSYSKSQDAAKQVVDHIKKAGGEADMCGADVKNAKAVSALFKHTLEKYGAINIVVSNAGIGHFSSMADTTDEDYDMIFDTNTRGTFNMCREAARHIADGGRVINISSGITQRSMGGMGLYTASKLALEGLSKTLAHELAARQITVNTISPGMTETPILDGAQDPQALREMGAASALFKRLGQPEDIADMVAALVSHDGRWVTGQNIHVDGGTVIS